MIKERRERKCCVQQPQQDTDLWSSRRDSSLDTQAGWLRMALPILLLSTAKKHGQLFKQATLFPGFLF